MKTLPKAPLVRIMKKAGIIRANRDAISAFGEAVEEIGEEIAKKSVELSRFAKRSTVKKEDVKLATH